MFRRVVCYKLADDRGAYDLHHRDDRPDDGGSKYLWESVSFYQIALSIITEDSDLHTHRWPKVKSDLDY
jgi:hypothetical protein